jgi:hypothetical protein
MLQHNEIKTGAAAIRRTNKGNPMEVLVRIREGDPTAGQERQFKKWWDEIQSDDDLLDAVARHTFTNLCTAIDKHRETVRKSRARAKAIRRAEARLVESLAQTVAKVAYLELTMPNGKKLRNCTFADCGAFGGFYKRLALKGKPSEIVGKKMTDEDIRNLYATGKRANG